jgi:hypothetical protein
VSARVLFILSPRLSHVSPAHRLSPPPRWIRRLASTEVYHCVNGSPRRELAALRRIPHWPSTVRDSRCCAGRRELRGVAVGVRGGETACRHDPRDAAAAGARVLALRETFTSYPMRASPCDGCWGTAVPSQPTLIVSPTIPPKCASPHSTYVRCRPERTFKLSLRRRRTASPRSSFMLVRMMLWIAASSSLWGRLLLAPHPMSPWERCAGRR